MFMQSPINSIYYQLAVRNPLRLLLIVVSPTKLNNFSGNIKFSSGNQFSF